MLGHRAFRRLIFVGVFVSPVIGLVVGWMLRRLNRASVPVRVAASALTLYGAATLFGLVLGLGAVLNRTANQNMEVLIEPVLAVLWGITFTGYFVVLWPLAYVTQAWVLGAATHEHDA